MRTTVSTLEPAVRDPRKLRKTAFWLVLIMVVSGAGILASYAQWMKKQADDDRPAFVGRLSDQLDFPVTRQDGSKEGLNRLFGHVTIYCGFSARQQDDWKATRAVLQKLAARYAGREDFHIVCLTVDPANEGIPLLEATGKDLGASLPQWWLASTGEAEAHKFLKNTLKLGFTPERKGDKWSFDPALTVVDRDRHLRQATIKSSVYSRARVTLDFEQAARWDAEGRTKGLEKSNQETLEALLFKMVDDLLAHPVTQ